MHPTGSSTHVCPSSLESGSRYGWARHTRWDQSSLGRNSSLKRDDKVHRRGRGDEPKACPVRRARPTVCSHFARTQTPSSLRATPGSRSLTSPARPAGARRGRRRRRAPSLASAGKVRRLVVAECESSRAGRSTEAGLFGGQDRGRHGGCRQLVVHVVALTPLAGRPAGPRQVVLEQQAPAISSSASDASRCRAPDPDHLLQWLEYDVKVRRLCSGSQALAELSIGLQCRTT